MMGVVDRGKVKGPVEVFAVKSGKAVKIYRGLLAQGGAARQFYSWGSGTEDDPYIIRTYADLLEMRHDLSAHYRLAANIKEQSKTLCHVPIGTEDAPFTGSLDGDGYTIKLHRLFGPQSPGQAGTCGGLFGINAGTVKNLDFQATVESTDDLTAYENFGMLAGVNRGTVENCRIVSGWKHNNTQPFGAVAGRNESGGVIRNVECRTVLFNAGAGKLGLLAGVNAGLIDHCYTDIKGKNANGNEVGFAVHTLEATGRISYAHTFVTKTEYPKETPFDFVVQQAEGSYCLTCVMKAGGTDTYIGCYPPSLDTANLWFYLKATDPFFFTNAYYRCVRLKAFDPHDVDTVWIEGSWR